MIVSVSLRSLQTSSRRTVIQPHTVLVTNRGIQQCVAAELRHPTLLRHSTWPLIVTLSLANVFRFDQGGVAHTTRWPPRPVRRLHPIIRKTLITISLVVGIPLLILLLPVILPYIAITERIRLQRLVRRPCDECGTPFGRDEIERARHECGERNRKIRSEIMARGGRPRIVSIWHIRCPNCDAKYTYAPSTAHLRRRATVV